MTNEQTHLLKIAPEDLVSLSALEPEHNIRIELAYARSDNLLLGEPVYRSDAQLWAHKDIAAITLLTARILNKKYGWVLELKDCLRTVEAQAAMQETDIVKAHPESARLMSSAVTSQNIERIDKLARDKGIEWFATPMYLDAVKLLDPYVKRFKVRQFDGRKIIRNEPSELFENISKTKKEIIISSEESPKNSSHYQNPNIRWLYCVPKYPCTLSEIDFSSLSDFDGYSNHHPHFIAPLTAAILGAGIIEVHVTMDKSKSYIDNNVSFDFNELENMIQLIKKSESIKK